MPARVAFIGSGDLANLMRQYLLEEGYDVIGAFDDIEKIGTIKNALKILGKTTDVKKMYDANQFDFLVIAIGYTKMSLRKNYFEHFQKLEIPFLTFIHHKAFVAPTSKIGQGSIILPGTIIDQQVYLQENVFVHIGCCISHDTIIGRHTYLSPSVSIAGFVNIGECCFLGIRSTIIDRIRIHDTVVLGGGAVVIHDILESGVYFGVPAKKRNV